MDIFASKHAAFAVTIAFDARCFRQRVQPRKSGGGGGKKDAPHKAVGTVAAPVAGKTVFETTRSGRVRLPPLAFWCNQTVVKVPLAAFRAANPCMPIP